MKAHYAILFLCFLVSSNVTLADDVDSNFITNSLYPDHQINNQRLVYLRESLFKNPTNHHHLIIPMRNSASNDTALSAVDIEAQTEAKASSHPYDTDSKTQVYDYQGKPITEEEIRARMISDYSTGCCLLGGIVGSAASFLLGCAVLASIDDGSGDAGSMTLLAIWGVGTGVSAWGGYKAGKEIDRRRAIELIMEERRTGETVPTPKPKFSTGVIGVLLVTGLAMIIMGNL